MDSGMSEILVMSVANVNVLLYDSSTKSWGEARPLDGQMLEDDVIPSVIYLLTNSTHSSARIVARKQTMRQEVILNCSIGQGLQYKRPTPRFFEWRDSNSSNIFGFNFYLEPEADLFVRGMQDVISKLGASKKVEPQSPPCNNIHYDTIPVLTRMPKGSEKLRDSLERSMTVTQLSPNLEHQSGPMPFLTTIKNEPNPQCTIRQDFLPANQSKKVPPPPPSSTSSGKSDYGRVTISTVRPKTLLPGQIVIPPNDSSSTKSPIQVGGVPPPFIQVGGVPTPPPPPPPPPNSSASVAPVRKTQRSLSMGLLDGLSAVQLKTTEPTTSSNGGNYNDIMSEIVDRIKKRKEREAHKNESDTVSINGTNALAGAGFNSSVRPQSGKLSKVPPPTQLPGRSLRKNTPLHPESSTSGTLPSVAEKCQNQGLLMEKMEHLMMDFEKFKVELNNRLDKFQDDVINAIKIELVRR